MEMMYLLNRHLIYSTIVRKLFITTAVFCAKCQAYRSTEKRSHGGVIKLISFPPSKKMQVFRQVNSTPPILRFIREQTPVIMPKWPQFMGEISHSHLCPPNREADHEIAHFPRCNAFDYILFQVGQS